jgi:DivIVA domain-containing protein
MDISPNDLRTYEFQAQMRGYDKEEVRNILEKAATALEKSKQDHLRLSMEMDSLRSQLAGLRQFEDSIKNAAIDARRNADQTIANAKREAEILMTKARAEAEQVFGSRTNRVEELEAKITALENTHKNYMAKLRSLISSHMDMVNENAPIKLDGTRTSEPGPLDVTDSADITTKSRTTFATEPEAPKPVHFEEANAPGKFIASLPTQQKPVTQTSQVDPELAATLEQYTNRSGKVPTQQPPAPITSKIPTQQFATVHEPPATPAPDASGRLHISSNFSSPQSFEHSSINIDASTAPAAKPQPPSNDGSLSADNLADELDRVVAKFEEEISKAEKS